MPNPSILARDEKDDTQEQLSSGSINSREVWILKSLDKLSQEIAEIKRRLDVIERKLIFGNPLKG